MPRTIPRVAGLISVVIFGGLLGFLVFALVQDQEAEQEVPVQPTHDILAGPTVMSLETALQDSPSLAEYYELSAPEAVPPPEANPGGDEHISGTLMVDYEGFACIDSSPHLLIRIIEPLPPGAMVQIQPSGEWVIESPGYPSTGPAYESPIPSGIAAVRVDLSSVLAGGATENLTVFVEAPGSNHRSGFISLPAFIDVSGADCGTRR